MRWLGPRSRICSMSTSGWRWTPGSGWLDRVRLGLVHCDQQIFIESYDEFHYSTALGVTPAAGFSPQIH